MKNAYIYGLLVLGASHPAFAMSPTAGLQKLAAGEIETYQQDQKSIQTRKKTACIAAYAEEYDPLFPMAGAIATGIKESESKLSDPNSPFEMSLSLLMKLDELTPNERETATKLTEEYDSTQTDVEESQVKLNIQIFSIALSKHFYNDRIKFHEHRATTFPGIIFYHSQEECMRFTRQDQRDQMVVNQDKKLIEDFINLDEANAAVAK